MKKKKPVKKRARHSNWEESAAQALREWAQAEDVYAIEEFYTARNIPRRTWDDAVARNEVLFEANDYAKIRCGLNREKLALKNNLGMNSTAAFSLTQFLDRWKKDIEWRSKLKQEQINSLKPEQIQEILNKYFSVNQ